MTGWPFMAIRSFFVQARTLWGAAVRRVQGAPYCILPEEDVGRVCQILVDENRWGRVA